MKSERERHLFYYQRELSFLREMGTVFAAQHPKIAKRLGLSKEHASDPHVERVIESFAFLTSYLQKDIESQFPRVTQALLDTLFPTLVRPIPSMGILEYTLDENVRIESAQTLKRGAKVYTSAGKSNDHMARFQTASDIVFHPIKVVDVSICSLRHKKRLNMLSKHGSALEVKLTSLGRSFHSMKVPSLRFFLHMPRAQALTLYSHLMRAETPIGYTVGDSDECHVLPQSSVAPVGLKPTDAILPCQDTHYGYALLQEYFYFPEKFFFIDVPFPQNLDAQDVTLVLPLATSDKLSEYVFNHRSLRLHCVPVVNLFEKTSEPLTFDHTKLEYRLVPDRQKEKNTEIYAINEIYSVRSLSEKARTVAPYFSYDYKHLLDQTDIYWSARRALSTRGYAGTDTYLSLVDRDAKPLMQSQETVYARTLCTNRIMAADIQEGTIFYSEESTPAKRILNVLEMTEPLYPDYGGVSQWKLISMLSTSYLMFSNGEEGAERLRNLLSLLSEMTILDHQSEIESIRTLTVSACVSRFTPENDWAGFYNGQSLKICIDEHQIKAEQLFLLLSLLDTFFVSQTQLHTFCQVAVQTNMREGIWHTWLRRSGLKSTL